MATAETRVHIICGFCGSKDHMTYEVDRDELIINEAEDNEERRDLITLCCGNCDSLTTLDELMKEKRDE